MIPVAKIREFRKALESCARPLIFFDDDPDGMCSFLLLYSLNPESRGVIYKRSGPLDNFFLNKVRENEPDAVFIVDVAEVSQDFLNSVNNCYWLDHHKPVERKNVKYYNPMIKTPGDNRPTSYWAYKIAQKNIWLAMVGCVGDWHLPADIKREFIKEYPELLDKKIKKPEQALFASDVGKLAKVLSFILKGDNAEAMACVKTLTRIHDPREILDQSTSQGKFIWKKHLRHAQVYNDLKARVKITDEPLVLFNYEDNRTSLTSDLSNEILFENPDKFIIICRHNNGEMKCSLRSAKYEVLPILEKALKGLNGFGGGHLHACGCQVNEKDFEKFLENVRKEL